MITAIPPLTVDQERDLMAMCGGRPKMNGGEKVWWFGMNPSDPKHTDEIAVPFDPSPAIPEVKGARVCLWKFPQQLNGGKHIPYNWQLTGSCVNGGGNNALSVADAIQVIREGEAGSWHIPWTLTSYGGGRKMAFNDDSEGEGSTGDAMAMALRDIGYTSIEEAAAIQGVPTPKLFDSAYCYTAQDELRFSAYHNSSQALRDACKKHNITFTKLTSLDECERSIRRCEPFTIAGNWGSRMRMQYKGTGPERVLFGDYASSWEHQQSVHAVWLHPSFGRLWYVMNQWYQVVNGIALPVHGAPANDEPPGGYWVDDSMIQHQLNYRYGELRGYRGGQPFTDGQLSLLAV